MEYCTPLHFGIVTIEKGATTKVASKFAHIFLKFLYTVALP